MRSFECTIKPQSGECVQTALSLPQPEMSIFNGQVLEPDGSPAEQALVLLLDQSSGKPLGYTVTDPLGRFWLGPVPANELYILRVQKSGVQLRTVEVQV